MSMETDFGLLNSYGLNMQAVFDLAALPAEIRSDIEMQVPCFADYRQLILIAHGGGKMWEAMRRSAFRDAADSIDSFSVDTVRRWIAEELPEARFHIVYPASGYNAPLQSLGKLAGWHHDSPFRIGVNQAWGSWFAYRVAVLADSDLLPTQPLHSLTPCSSCVAKPCLSACPAGAMESGDFSLPRCIGYRLAEDSHCKSKCLARLACPVAAEHRYSTAQISYHYVQSLQVIKGLHSGTK